MVSSGGPEQHWLSFERSVIISSGERVDRGQVDPKTKLFVVTILKAPR